MRLKLKRCWCKDKYTIGKLYLIEDDIPIWLADTLEDKVRDLNKDGDLNDIGEGKIYGETAIPYGEYKIDMNTISPKFSKYPFYLNVCGGKLPRLLNVPHFDGILIHVADGHKGADLLQGCIGVGENKIKGGLLNGKAIFEKVYTYLFNAHKTGEEIILEVV